MQDWNLFLWASGLTIQIVLFLLTLLMWFITKKQAYKLYLVYAVLFLISFAHYKDFVVNKSIQFFQIERIEYISIILVLQNIGFGFYALFTNYFLEFHKSKFLKKFQIFKKFYFVFIALNLLFYILFSLMQKELYFIQIGNYLFLIAFFVVAGTNLIYLFKEMNQIKRIYLGGICTMFLLALVSYLLLYIFNIGGLNNIQQRTIGQIAMFSGVIIEGVTLMLSGLVLFSNKSRELEKQRKILIQTQNNKTISELTHLARFTKEEYKIFNSNIQKNVERPLEQSLYMLNRIDSTKPNIEDAKYILEQALLSVQQQTDNKYPELLKEHGVIVAIEHYTKQSPYVKIVVVDEVEDEIEISDDSNSILFSALCELIDLVNYNSKSSKGVIFFDETEETIIINIKDNGSGVSAVDVKEYSGLNNAKHKIDLLDGKFTIKTEIDRGTFISIELTKQKLKSA